MRAERRSRRGWRESRVRVRSGSGRAAEKRRVVRVVRGRGSCEEKSKDSLHASCSQATGDATFAPPPRTLEKKAARSPRACAARLVLMLTPPLASTNAVLVSRSGLSCVSRGLAPMRTQASRCSLSRCNLLCQSSVIVLIFLRIKEHAQKPSTSLSPSCHVTTLCSFFQVLAHPRLRTVGGGLAGVARKRTCNDNLTVWLSVKV